MMNCTQWINTLKVMLENTNYEVLYNVENVSGAESAIIIEKTKTSPKYIKIYPKQSKTNIVIKSVVKEKVEGCMSLEQGKIKGSEYHYQDVSDKYIMNVCKNFIKEV